MNRLPFIILLSLLLWSCNADKEKSSSTNENKEEEEIISAPPSVAIPAINLLGSYVGEFGDNKIALLVTKIAGDTVEGRSVVGGNDRPFNGTLKIKGNSHYISAREPGDDQYDGAFDFIIDTKNPDVVTGSWKPYKPTATIKEKTYTLQRKAFKYLKDVGEYPQASQRLLKEKDVENLAKQELEMMRNEIFARHGYCFKKKHLREQFENKDWYIPNTVDVRKDLTEIETKNIFLIKRYEKYVEEFGDVFGR